MVFSLIAEASRRRARVPQLLVACLLLLGQFIGIGTVMLGFLASLNIWGTRQVERDMPEYDIDPMRAGYLLGCNIIYLVFGLIVVPNSASQWPGGELSELLLAIALFLPGLPLLAFAMDKTSSRAYFKDAAAQNRIHPSICDRDLGHYIVMANAGVSGLVGLLVHLRALGTFFTLYDSTEEFFAEATVNGPALFLGVDLLFLLIGGYTWLQVEALAPVTSYFSGGVIDQKVLSWRDLLTLMVFGPVSHWCIAFASREYTLMRIDGLRLKAL